MEHIKIIKQNKIKKLDRRTLPSLDFSFYFRITDKSYFLFCHKYFSENNTVLMLLILTGIF